MPGQFALVDEFTREPRTAYFSMEIALRSDIPTYAGGLGVLAGDVVRTASDLELPLVAVMLVSRDGYFRQEIDAQGRQIEQQPPHYAPLRHGGVPALTIATVAFSAWFPAPWSACVAPVRRWRPRVCRLEPGPKTGVPTDKVAQGSSHARARIRSGSGPVPRTAGTGDSNAGEN